MTFVTPPAYQFGCSSRSWQELAGDGVQVRSTSRQHRGVQAPGLGHQDDGLQSRLLHRQALHLPLARLGSDSSTLFLCLLVMPICSFSGT
jgi:hypothetical protein